MRALYLVPHSVTVSNTFSPHLAAKPLNKGQPSGGQQRRRHSPDIPDQSVLVRDLASGLPDGVLGLVKDGVGGSIWVRHDDRLLDVDGKGAREERQSGEEKAKESHGGVGIVLVEMIVVLVCCVLVLLLATSETEAAMEG
jgi:hypothetical protein